MNQKKKGFTLIELLAVLVILAFILLATVPAVSGILSRNKQRLYREQVNLIIKTSKDWALQNSSMVPSDEQDPPYYLSLEELANEGLIESSNLKDPRTEQDMHGCVRISYEKNQYSYEFLEKDCSEFTDSLLPVIHIQGGDNQKVEINTPYTLPSVTATSASGESLAVTGPVIKTNGQTVTEIKTNQLRQVYTLTYSTTDTSTGYQRNYTMTLTVVDTISPVITVLGSNQSQTIEVTKGSTFVTPTATVTDNSGDSIQTTTSGSVNTSKTGTYTITYLATDNSKNDTALILTVKVV